MLYFILCWLSKRALRVFFKLKIIGVENIPRKKGCIIVSNHISFLDPIVIAATSFRKVNFLARQSLFKNYLFGKFLRSINVSFITRDSANIKALKKALVKLKENKVIALFPQGTRQKSWEGAKKGAGFLCQRANVYVIPTYVKGTDKALPRGAKFIKFSPLTIYFGKAIIPSAFNSGNKKEMLQKINAEIIRRIRQLQDSAERDK